MAYITLPRALLAEDDEWFPAERRSCDVIVEEGGPQPTGLLDADGNALYRVASRAPCGFCR